MKEKVSSHPFYLRLKEALNASTDTQLAKMLKVTKQSVNGWKKNGKVKRSRLESVAKLTGVSLGWLLTGEAEKYPTQKQPKPELTRSIGREEFARSVTVSVSPQSFHSCLLRLNWSTINWLKYMVQDTWKFLNQLAQKIWMKAFSQAT